MAQAFTVSLGESEGFIGQAQGGVGWGAQDPERGNGTSGNGEAMRGGGNVG